MNTHVLVYADESYFVITEEEWEKECSGAEFVRRGRLEEGFFVACDDNLHSNSAAARLLVLPDPPQGVEFLYTVAGGPSYEINTEDGPSTDFSWFISRETYSAPQYLATSFQSKHDAVEAVRTIDQFEESEWDEDNDPWSAYKGDYEEDGKLYNSNHQRIG